MKRQIIKIDEEKCTGCGLCIPNCPEGALQIINGKARLVGELFCDGLGACLGKCPEGAISVEERDAPAYNEARVMANIIQGGAKVIAAHLKHLRDHQQSEYLRQALDYLKGQNIPIPVEETAGHRLAGGCPGSMMKDLRRERKTEEDTGAEAARLSSELRQWPVQLHLLNPAAPYFQEADLVVAADCVPFSYPNFHHQFLKGKTLVVFCPKLDTGLEEYREKLSTIFSRNEIKSITIVHMEVPCCFGTVSLVQEALRRSGKDIPVEDITISLGGEVI